MTTGDATPQKTPYLAQMNLYKQWTRCWKPTPRVATRIIATTPKDVKFSAGEPQYAIGNDVGKPKQSVATPPEDAIITNVILRMPLDTMLVNRCRHKDTTFCVDGPRKPNGHDVGKPTPSVASRRPHKTPYLAQMKHRMPSDTT
jgi:hypothetical protein